MAFDIDVKEAFETLTLEQQIEVVDFIMYLKAKKKVQKEEKKYPFDVFSGDSFFIAEDFDETPDWRL